MSEFREAVAAIVADRQCGTAEGCVNLRSGLAFSAEIEPVADLELNTALGRDPRESVLFHVLDRAAAAGINQNDRLKALGAVFVVLRRQDNPASPLVEFGCMKLVEGRDA